MCFFCHLFAPSGRDLPLWMPRALPEPGLLRGTRARGQLLHQRQLPEPRALGLPGGSRAPERLSGISTPSPAPSAPVDVPPTLPAERAAPAQEADPAASRAQARSGGQELPGGS
jgi:hypothetical protein